MAELVEPDAVGVHCHRGLERTWDGSIFRVVEFQSAEGAVVPAPEHASALVSFMLEERGGPAACRLDRSIPLRRPHVPKRISFLPAGVPGWTATDRGGRFRLAGLEFDPQMIVGELAELGCPRALEQPEVSFANERIWQLGHALAVECCQPDTLSLLHCQSLAVSLIIELVRHQTLSVEPRTGGLSKKKLTLVTDYLRDNLARQVTLRELAELTGHSLSHVCHAFKRSTGLPPHRWQLEARIQRAEHLMREPKRTLSGIAHDCGFADQAHFTRVFRRARGLTPSVWRHQLR